MAEDCVSTVYGSGVSCATGGAVGNYGLFTFNGRVTFSGGIQCGRSGLWVVLDGRIIGQPYFLYGDATVDVVCKDLSGNPCDCINGGCVPKTTYGTPGVFANLAACQSGCAKNSTCAGECVDPAEIAALKQALNTLQSKFCH